MLTALATVDDRAHYAQTTDSRRRRQWTSPTAVNSRRRPSPVDHIQRLTSCTSRWATGRDGVARSIAALADTCRDMLKLYRSTYCCMPPSVRHAAGELNKVGLYIVPLSVNVSMQSKQRPESTRVCISTDCTIIRASPSCFVATWVTRSPSIAEGPRDDKIPSSSLLTAAQMYACYSSSPKVALFDSFW